MLTHRRILAGFLGLLVGALCASAQGRGPSTPEERARAVQIAQRLQTDPLAPEVQPEREWLIKWLIEIPDLSVSLCTDFLGDLGDSKSGYPGAIIAAMMASQAAFLIEHPDKMKDRNAEYLAGVEGALKAYEAIRSKDPKLELLKVDSLLELRGNGKLAGYVQDTAKKKCRPKR